MRRPVLVLAAAVDHSWVDLRGALVGGLTAFVLFFLLWFFVPRGIGRGDVRLAGLIGLETGYFSLLHVYAAFLVGFVAGMVFGIALRLTAGAGRKTSIPFAPSLALGAVYSVLWGSSLIHALFPSAT